MRARKLFASFPAPAFGECRHRGHARRFVAARDSKNGVRAAIVGKRRLLGELRSGAGGPFRRMPPCTSSRSRSFTPVPFSPSLSWATRGHEQGGPSPNL